MAEELDKATAAAEAAAAAWAGRLARLLQELLDLFFHALEYAAGLKEIEAGRFSSCRIAPPVRKDFLFLLNADSYAR